MCIVHCRSSELRLEYDQLKAKYFEAECEQKKARQLFITVRHDLKELKKLLASTKDYNSLLAQFVSYTISHCHFYLLQLLSVIIRPH